MSVVKGPITSSSIWDFGMDSRMKLAGNGVALITTPCSNAYINLANFQDSLQDNSWNWVGYVDR